MPSSGEQPMRNISVFGAEPRPGSDRDQRYEQFGWIIRGDAMSGGAQASVANHPVTLADGAWSKPVVLASIGPRVCIGFILGVAHGASYFLQLHNGEGRCRLRDGAIGLLSSDRVLIRVSDHRTDGRIV